MEVKFTGVEVVEELQRKGILEDSLALILNLNFIQILSGYQTKATNAVRSMLKSLQEVGSCPRSHYMGVTNTGYNGLSQCCVLGNLQNHWEELRATRWGKF